MIAVLMLVLLLCISGGWWRSTGVGPQVSVPMFYDAHYLFPRPWTQAQAAPPVPEPAPVAALYGPNRVSQSFVAGADQLAMVTIWLAGPVDSAVTASLSSEGGRAYSGEVTLAKGNRGGYYHLTFPPIEQARGRSFRLTLAAPEATEEQPVLTRTVGGDRLGGAIRINEYSQPGNLELYTYSRGAPGRWWLDSLVEQILPALFRLRVQQYKPALFKGVAFPLLLGLMAALCLTYLALAGSLSRPPAIVSGWWCVGLLVGLLGWQLAGGRLLLPGVMPTLPLEAANEPLAIARPVREAPRLVHDMVHTLWTAEREPEARFVTTATVAGYPAIHVPARSALRYTLVVPPNGRLRAGVSGTGQGELRFAVRFNDAEIAAKQAIADGSVTWFDLDLSPWTGAAGTISFITEPTEGRPDALWLMPQLHATAEWLLSDLPPSASAVQPAGYRFGQFVELLGYEVEPPSRRPAGAAEVTLYWQANASVTEYATVFVHLLDQDGALVAQHDSQPVVGTYPLPAWLPGTVVADRHTLTLPAALPAGDYSLAVGLYDPDTMQRWPITAPEGLAGDDGRALLPVSIVEAAP